MNQKNATTYKITLTGLIAALSYVVFTFLQIKIMIPGTESATSIHLGNAVCVLGALLLGGPLGGIGGAVGMTIGDLLDPVYITSAPKTLILKLCIGLVTGFVAHRLGKLSTCKDGRTAFKWSLTAAICGLGFNMVFDPLFSYCYKLIILGKPMAELTLLPNIATTTINAVTSTIVSVAAYNAIRPALREAGLLPVIGKSAERQTSDRTKSAS
ncbi:MAG: ECF transporter S component [Lachnospiraceae bacterium]|nr:ECF transporter S component [Lachnospiraceae bacterium]